MAYFEHDGIRFRYEVRGESGLPFFFQHGLGGDLRQTLAVFQPPSGIRLISMDSRGHGETRPLGEIRKLRFSAMADDVVALMDHLGFVEPVVVGGISMGAGIALNLALRHPGRTAALVLVRPAWLDRPYHWNVAMFSLVGRILREHGPVAGRQVFMAMEEYQNLLHTSPDNALALLNHFDSPRAMDAVDRLEQIPNDAPNHDSREWGTIQVPGLVVGCDLDPIHPLEFARTLGRAIPQAQFIEVVPKSTDLLAYARQVQEALNRFLCESVIKI